MSMNQTEMNPNWAQPQQQKKSCGPLSCLLIGCGGMMLLCCGVGLWGIFYVRSMVSDDPVRIAAERARIAEIDIPADLEPTMAINAKFPFYGEIGFGVIYADREGGSLILMTINRSFAEAEESDLERVLQESLRQEGSEQERDFQVRQRDEKQLTVRGKPVTFYFATGKNTKTGADLVEVKGTFEGKSGPTMFYFLGDAEKYDEANLTEIIASIQ